MTENKNLTQNGLTTQHSILVLLSITMLGVCIYLTNHYFNIHFPTQIGGQDSICDISKFWNCDSATHSNISNVFNVPIAFLGVILSISLIIGSIFPSNEAEKTNKFLVGFNLIGCIVLFIYSLAVLGSLCPMCSIYYVLSGLVFYLFFKYSNLPFVPSPKHLALWGVILIGTSLGMRSYFVSKQTKQDSVSSQIVEQFNKLANLGDPANESPYKIHMGTENFADAPIRLSVFSDFQCPFCKVVSEQLSVLSRYFKEKINIQYFFYPLDNNCNPKVTGKFHEYACKAAFLAACDSAKFVEIHDAIFAKQETLNNEILNEISNNYKMSHCFADEKAKNAVLETMKAADQFNLKSTPTLILNGVKIEGTLPTNQLIALMNSLLKKAE
jgi:protein-disulfide isomerase/uncharacterized membrane protein